MTIVPANAHHTPIAGACPPNATPFGGVTSVSVPNGGGKNTAPYCQRS